MVMWQTCCDIKACWCVYRMVGPTSKYVMNSCKAKRWHLIGCSLTKELHTQMHSLKFTYKRHVPYFIVLFTLQWVRFRIISILQITIKRFYIILCFQRQYYRSLATNYSKKITNYIWYWYQTNYYTSVFVRRNNNIKQFSQQ